LGIVGIWDTKLMIASLQVQLAEVFGSLKAVKELVQE
jgi:hypothetical protein